MEISRAILEGFIQLLFCCTDKSFFHGFIHSSNINKHLTIYQVLFWASENTLTHERYLVPGLEKDSVPALKV